MLAFNSAAEPPAQAPTPVLPVLTTPSRQTSPAEAPLHDLFRRLERSRLGRELLAFAREQDLSIEAATPEALDPEPDDIFAFQGRAQAHTGTILINTTLRHENEVLLTLVHELRHLWQNRIARIDDLTLDTRREWLQDRYKEADAFAFEVHFAYEYAKETKEPFHFSRPAFACHVRPALNCMYEKYAGLRDAGTPIGDAYAVLVADALALVRTLNYDAEFLAYKKERWQEVLEDPERGRMYEVLYRAPSSDAAFVDTMRRVFTIGLHPHEDPEGLASWTADDFLSLDKTAGVLPQHMCLYEEIIALQDSAMTAYFKRQIAQAPDHRAASIACSRPPANLASLPNRPLLP